MHSAVPQGNANLMGKARRINPNRLKSKRRASLLRGRIGSLVIQGMKEPLTPHNRKERNAVWPNRMDDQGEPFKKVQNLTRYQDVLRKYQRVFAV